jgi:hypothetical protein
MSTPPQALLDKIKQLPPQRMAEVEDFVDFLRSRDKASRAGPAARAPGSAQPTLKGRFQGRATTPVSIRDMDEAIAAEVVAAHSRAGKRAT